ncbi:MAG: hypothetical protein M5U08_17445 [Burkholderiales bacterium]|nr:hypothetical protein [Burkholderiales bacterium]
MRIGIIGGGVIGRLILEHVASGALEGGAVAGILGRGEDARVVGLVCWAASSIGLQQRT